MGCWLQGSSSSSRPPVHTRALGGGGRGGGREGGRGRGARECMHACAAGMRAPPRARARKVAPAPQSPRGCPGADCYNPLLVTAPTGPGRLFGGSRQLQLQQTAGGGAWGCMGGGWGGGRVRGGAARCCCSCVGCARTNAPPTRTCLCARRLRPLPVRLLWLLRWLLRTWVLRRVLQLRQPPPPHTHRARLAGGEPQAPPARPPPPAGLRSQQGV